MAPQFGQAIGQPDGLRNALGFTDAEGTWHPRRPDPKLYETEVEPHARGDLLVGAVFEAFKKIYESRVADLRRIATHGSGVLPRATCTRISINRFTQEAAKSARHVLDMCMRALDYMPPVEATFGDFLRAIVTADADLVPDDDRRYRVAFVDAFRSYGIGPAEHRDALRRHAALDDAARNEGNRGRLELRQDAGRRAELLEHPARAGGRCGTPSRRGGARSRTA